jgi:hypothetical protein
MFYPTLRALLAPRLTINRFVVSPFADVSRPETFQRSHNSLPSRFRSFFTFSPRLF